MTSQAPALPRPSRRTTRRPAGPLNRHLRRLLVGGTVAAVTGGVLAAAPAAHATPAATGAAPISADDQLPPGRKVITRTVRRGDTATGLAVRHHAWTAELIRLNGLGSHATLRVGERVRIPVVLSALTPRERRQLLGKPSRGAGAKKPDQHKKGGHKKAQRPKATTPRKQRHDRSAGDRVRRPGAHPSRAAVRRVITQVARRVGVDPHLALAVSWQEAGWQMHHVSSANAIGAMQVLPDTGTWMEMYAGRELDLRKTRDNVTAGVTLLDVLAAETNSRRHQVAAYYQGLGAVREHGLYDETKPYVRNVLAIKRRLERGQPPA